MKNIPFSIFFISLALLLFGACKSTKSTASTKAKTFPAAGMWDYEVTNTPDGDNSGVLTLTPSGDTYIGKINGDAGETELSDLKIVDKKLTCTFEVQGYEAEIAGDFDGDNFTGKVMVAGYEFPMTMVRKK